MEAQIQVRRDVAAQWTSVNPILAQGEPGLELDTGKGKYGDGSTRWNSLDYSWTKLGGGPSGPAGGALAGSYPNPTLAPDSVGANQINDGSVGAAELGAGAVTTAKIGDGQVTTAKIGDSQVSLAKLAPNSVDTSKIVDGSIGLGDLNSGTVDSLMVDVYDEGTAAVVNAARINFVGAGVNASGSAGVATVTVTGVAASAVIPGTIAYWYDSTPPAGWLNCSGQVVASMAGTVGTRYGPAGTLPTIVPKAIDTSRVDTVDVIASTFAGWRTDQVVAYIRSGDVHLVVQVTRTGATLVLNNPNHADQAVCILKAPFLPDFNLGGSCWNNTRTFSISTTGQINLNSGMAAQAEDGSNIVTGDVFSLYAVYPVAAFAVIPRIYGIIKDAS